MQNYNDVVEWAKRHNNYHHQVMNIFPNEVPKRYHELGARGDVVFKVVRYKSAGDGFDSR
jgi:hypothetical protein